MTKKQLEHYIAEIRPKADAYDRICEELGIENNILEYIQSIKLQKMQSENNVTDSSHGVIKNKIKEL